jgi:alpha/beta superfamily hydrolase
MVIVPDSDHCFTGKENELIKIIQPWIQQSID